MYLPDWLYYTLSTIYFVTICAIIGVVVSENRNPLKSLAWVTVLLFLPIGGVILYIFFGRSIKNQRMISRRNRKKLLRFDATTPQATLSTLNEAQRQEAMLAQSLDKAVLYTDNRVEIFQSANEKFNRLLSDIAAARHYIHIQYYIIESDEIGGRLADALIAKAREGVNVRIIYDHIGSMRLSRSYRKRLKEAGIQVHPFFRVAFPPFATKINWRNHRKIAVIDGQIGYIGGMNVADRYLTGGKFNKWRDTHIRIEGPAVNALHYSFAVDWSFMGFPLIQDYNAPKPYDGSDSVKMQLLTSGPTSEWSNISYQMLKMIGNAKKRVFIQTPYFLPTESLLRSLQVAALAKIDVRIMIPKKSDSLILTWASYSYIQECLRAGVKIYLYEGGMLHSKVMIIDSDLSAVGSANIDFRSFEHNFESTMFMYSKEVNSQLAEQFQVDQEESRQVKLSVWRHRPMSQKAMESLTRLLSPIL